MSNIVKAFENGKAFIAFLTAGDPSIEKTEEFIYAIERSGADLIEIGVPFSDPVAEGDVIQRSNLRALTQGVNLKMIFEMVSRVREKTKIPLVLLTYLNPVLIYGYDKFFSGCKSCGIDGVIIPDAPFEEKDEFAPFAKKYGVDVISLVAPTSDDRIAMIASEAEGFIYCVSSTGVTGIRKEIKTDLKRIIKEIKKSSGVPVAVGFGISTPEQARAISRYADGIITGSAIVKIIEEYEEQATEHVAKYVNDMKNAIKNP